MLRVGIGENVVVLVAQGFFPFSGHGETNLDHFYGHGEGPGNEKGEHDDSAAQEQVNVPVETVEIAVILLDEGLSEENGAGNKERDCSDQQGQDFHRHEDQHAVAVDPQVAVFVLDEVSCGLERGRNSAGKG